MPAQSEIEIRAKAKAFDTKMAAMAAESRGERRKTALQRVARIGGPSAAEAKRILAKESVTDEAAGLAALPRSIAEAGSARAYSKANMQREVAASQGQSPAGSGRASMLAELAKQGIEAVRR